MARQHGVTSETVNRLVLDAGAVYINYGEAGQTQLGATRGGSTFEVAQEFRDVEVDGALGPVRGLTRIINESPMITCELLEYSLEQVKRNLPGSASAARRYLQGVLQGSGAATHNVITRNQRTIPDADYLSNVAIVAEVSNKGVPLIALVKNALVKGNFTVATTDQNESTVPLTITGHFAPGDLNAAPWEIRIPV